MVRAGQLGQPFVDGVVEIYLTLVDELEQDRAQVGDGDGALL